MRTLIGLAVGAAGGFALARALEARAAGVPIGLALSMWDVPILRLRDDLGVRQAVEVRKLDPDAPMRPSFYAEDGGW
jgi:hypothetical protein